jgi:hypothetical protein
MQGVMIEGLSLFGHEEGVRQRIVVQARSSLAVVAELLCCARMQRHNAGLVELRLKNV